MTDKATYTIEVRSTIGRALMLQVLSALMIIGSLATFVLGLSVPTEWLAIMSVLYAIGFIQALVTRSVMQKDERSVPAATAASILAMILSIIVGFYWIIQPLYVGLGLYFIIVGMVNAILAVLLLEVQKTT